MAYYLNPKINIQPSTSAQAFCTGGTATPLSVTATGDNLSYQWYSQTSASTNTSKNITGATSNIYTPSTATVGTLYYSCTVRNTFGQLTTNVSGAVTVSDSIAPSVSIAATPSGAVNSGTSVTFTATPANGGSGPAYQWNKNGTNITGATNATYTYAPANGDVVTCTLTANNACQTTATATSNAITETVNAVATPPTLGTLGNITKNFGDSAFALTPPTSNSTGAFTYTSSNSSVATILGDTLTIVGAGTATITATQAATGIYASGSKTATLTVNKATPTVGTFANITKNFGDAAFALTAPASQSPVAFTYSSTNKLVATINGSTVTIVGAGTAIITASQVANANYNSISVTATLTVNKITPTLGTFANIIKTIGDAPFALTPPTSNSSGSFTYASSNKGVATIVGDSVTIVGAGTAIITAYQAAAGNYNALGSATATLAVNTLGSGSFTYLTPNVFTVGTGITPLVATSQPLFSPVGSGLSNGQNAAVDAQGNIYVTDYTNNSVKKISTDGSVVGLGTGFSSPQGIAVDSSGNVYVADGGNNAVKKIDANGNISTVGSGLKNPYGLALDATGNIYVADCGNNVVKEIAANGAITILGNGFKGINGPKGVALDISGNVFVTDYYNNRVVKIATNGNVTTFASGFINPYGLAIDILGNFYVASRGDNSIKIVSVNGTVSNLATGINAPQGVAVDAGNNVYVVNYGGKAVTKIAYSGTVSGFATTPALPAGLGIDTATGVITGTPTVTSPAANYTITYTIVYSPTNRVKASTNVNISVIANNLTATGGVSSLSGNTAKLGGFVKEGLARLSIAPNPVEGGVVRLVLGGVEKGFYTYRILDGAGRMVKTGNFEHGFSVSESLKANLTPGVYFLQVRGGGKVLEDRFQVIRN